MVSLASQEFKAATNGGFTDPVRMVSMDSPYQNGQTVRNMTSPPGPHNTVGNLPTPIIYESAVSN